MQPETANRQWIHSIEGYSDINVVFRSGNGFVQVLITNAANVPDLCHHLFPLPTLVKSSHTFEGHPSGVVARLKSERPIVFPLSGTLDSLYGYRVDRNCRGNACVVLAPGNCPAVLRLASTTSTARLDTPTKYYSARP